MYPGMIVKFSLVLPGIIWKQLCTSQNPFHLYFKPVVTSIKSIKSNKRLTRTASMLHTTFTIGAMMLDVSEHTMMRTAADCLSTPVSL
jgi:hypothetical protein